MIAPAVLIVGAAVAVVLVGWALVQAPRWARAALASATRPRPGNGTHERVRVAGRTVPPPGDKAQRDAAYAALQGLPAPGKDIYTDHNVWLPWTPSRQLTEAEMDEGRERWRAAQGKPTEVMPLPPVFEPADVDAQVADWQHILAPAPAEASDECHCGKAAGHLAEALAGDHPETAFDTGTIPAVTA